MSLDASPPAHRWMKDALDREQFHKRVPVLAARINASDTGKFLKAEEMRRSLLDLPRLRSVIQDPLHVSSEDRLVLLRVSDEASLEPSAREFLENQSCELVQHNIELHYDYWTADEILQAVLPTELSDGSPSGFSTMGHLAHVNLRKEYLPYKHVIGQVILDNTRIRTVVNKLDTIDTQFRFFKMELIAGEPDYVVQHRESDCTFTFDFTRVYFNSRLHTEHARIVAKFEPHELVADVFAGVGPFALPAARRGCGVLANDLNPESTRWLTQNVKTNRVGDIVRVSTEDGRDFIRAAATRVLDEPFPPYAPRLTRTQEKQLRWRSASRQESNENDGPPRLRIAHFIMNLPDSAITFLDAFRGIFTAGRQQEFEEIYGDEMESDGATMPMVHCYCFTRELEPDEAEADIRQRVEEKLGMSIQRDVSLYFVRKVAPNKDMYCISFRLPREVAFDTDESATRA